jgi:H+/Cl- antiporter ClcA
MGKVTFAPTIQGFWQGNNVNPQREPFMVLGLWLGVIGVFYFNAFRVKRVMFRLLDLHKVVR